MKGPIIIIGMHRSGTSMIAKLLESAGLFLGRRKDSHNEALFFLKINDWLLRQSGGSWDNPGSFLRMIGHQDIQTLLIKHLHNIIKSWHIYSFIGAQNYRKIRSLKSIDFPWGWKDPRNTYTLPLWFELFKNAKILHIYRHGVDVANSLMLRSNKSINKISQKVNQNNIIYRISPLRPNLMRSIRCHTLIEGFDLWKNYTDQAGKLTTQYKDRSLCIKYENFLGNPTQHMSEIISFCGLNSDEHKIEQMVKTVNKDRAFAFKASPELLAFRDSVIHELKTFGY